LHVVRLEIRSAVENARSRAVAERCGFLLEGIMRANTWGPGADAADLRVRDSCLYAKVF
jgi:RimJ/RimL family protein N-acetyltransferase